MTQFVEDNFDKFKDIRRRTSTRKIRFLTESKDDAGSGILYKGEIGLLYFETASYASLSLDVDYCAHEWAHLNRGSLIFHVDGKNHRFEPGEYHHSVIAGDTISESCLYTLTAEQLKTLAGATKWEVQISGSRAKHEFIVDESGIVSFRQFYNQVFDSSVFPESLSHQSPRAACFHPSTRILTPLGVRELSTLGRGDQVFSWSGRSCVPRQIMRVLHFPPTDLMSIQLVGVPESVRVTPSHTLRAKAGWVRAAALARGDVLVQIDHRGLPRDVVVDSVALEASRANVMNLHTAGEHNFIAASVLAHNFTVCRRLRTFAHRILFDRILPNDLDSALNNT